MLHGSMEVETDGNPVVLNPGDTLLIEPGVWHKFSTLDGVVFEELSTTDYNDDSYYSDPRISRVERAKRKTVISDWTL